MTRFQCTPNTGQQIWFLDSLRNLLNALDAVPLPGNADGYAVGWLGALSAMATALGLQQVGDDARAPMVWIVPNGQQIDAPVVDMLALPAGREVRR